MNRFYIAAAAALLLAASAFGDVLTQKDGSHLTGKIVAEDADSVTLQSNIDELVIQRQYAKKDLTQITRAPKADATFCKIPIEGEIGITVKASWLASALDQARLLKADYVILYFDSPGGKIDEMIKIIDLLKAEKKLKLIAHVKNAGSAAAVIALACPTIVLTPNGSIGAAVPFKFGPDGTPQDIEAKFFSYFESIARSAADAGGHSTLLVRGMMEMNLTLSRITNGHQVEIVEGQPPGGTVIKKSGEILTLQGKEALAAGLATALSDDVAGTASLVGLKSWSSVGDAPWSYMKCRETDRAATAAQIKLLQQQLAEPASQAQKAQAAAAKLADNMKADTQAVTDQYNQTIAAARPADKAAITKKAQENRDSQLAALNARYKPLFDEQKRLFDEAVAKINAFSTKLAQLQNQLTPR